MKRILWIWVLIISPNIVFSQDFKFGNITSAEFNYDISKIDKQANALVLNEFGTAQMEVNPSSGRIEVVLTYHVRIKIYNENGFDQANIAVNLYNQTQYEERLSHLSASTFNRVDGEIKETKLDAKNLFTENVNNYYKVTKFTMPDIQPGSIIEYSYRLSSPLIFNFRTWNFQSNIPKLNSQYIAIIPPIYNYNVSLKGSLKLSESGGVLLPECIVINGSRQDCSKMTYGMKNIPAFIEEDYMTAAENFKSSLNFELAEIVRLTGGTDNITKEWKNVDFELRNSKEFGTQIRRKDVFKNKLPNIIKGTTDDLAKAKLVYDFIKREIKWNGYTGYRSEDNIKKAYDLNSGNIGDINISLISALTDAGLDAEAVILSTRANGFPNKLYPILSDFNYVVAKLNIGDKVYLLDASDPLLPFGMLPLRCLNDQGRVINQKKPSYWIDLVANQQTNTTYILEGELNQEGKIKGKITIHSSGYSAYNKRSEIKEKNSVEEFVEYLDENMPNTRILNHKIINLDSLELALTEEYEVEINIHDNQEATNYHFNPFLLRKITKNPFNLSQRTYPVDLGWTYKEQQIIRVKMNENFEMLEKPQDLTFSLPEESAKFIVKSSFEDNTLSLDQSIQMNRAIFSPEYYSSLKEFYNKIIQTHNTEFLLKK